MAALRLAAGFVAALGTLLATSFEFFRYISGSLSYTYPGLPPPPQASNKPLPSRLAVPSTTIITTSPTPTPTISVSNPLQGPPQAFESTFGDLVHLEDVQTDSTKTGFLEALLAAAGGHRVHASWVFRVALALLVVLAAVWWYRPQVFKVMRLGTRSKDILGARSTGESHAGLAVPESFGPPGDDKDAVIISLKTDNNRLRAAAVRDSKKIWKITEERNLAQNSAPALGELESVQEELTITQKQLKRLAKKHQASIDNVKVRDDAYAIAREEVSELATKYSREQNKSKQLRGTVDRLNGNVVSLEVQMGRPRV